MYRRGYFLFLLVLLSACTKDSKPPQQTARAGDAERGRRVYLAQCTACHNSDPSRDGSVGPAIKGSSEALLEARLLHATYPPGHTPKRKTKTMPPQPYLKSAIPDLAAFLNASG